MVNPQDELHGDIEYAVEDGIAELVLDRPEAMNSIRRETLYDLEIARERAEEDDDIRAILMRSTGDSFCTGGDLGAVLEYLDSADEAEVWLEHWHQVFTGLHRTDLPVIGCVDGLALAGGLEVSLACDVVIASPDATFGDQHINHNLIPVGTGSQMLPRIIGRRRAKYLILSGDTIDAETAYEWGLVSSISEEPLEEAREFAEGVADRHPSAVRRSKELVDRGLETSVETGLALERKVGATHLTSDIVKEALQQFQER